MKQSQLQPWQFQSEFTIRQSINQQQSIVNFRNANEQTKKVTPNHSSNNVKSLPKNKPQRNVKTANSSYKTVIKIKPIQQTQNDKSSFKQKQSQVEYLFRRSEKCHSVQMKKPLSTTQIGYLDQCPLLASNRSKVVKCLLEKYQKLKNKSSPIKNKRKSLNDSLLFFQHVPSQGNSKQHFRKLLKMKDKLRPKKKFKQISNCSVDLKSQIFIQQFKSMLIPRRYVRPQTANIQIIGYKMKY